MRRFFFLSSFLFFFVFCSRFCSKAQSEKITIETITINSSVFYGITDVFTRIESLYPTFVLTRVNLPDVAVTVARFYQIPDTCTRWSILCRWKMRDLLQHHSHVTQHSVRVELD